MREAVHNNLRHDPEHVEHERLVLREGKDWGGIGGYLGTRGGLLLLKGFTLPYPVPLNAKRSITNTHHHHRGVVDAKAHRVSLQAIVLLRDYERILEQAVQRVREVDRKEHLPRVG